MKREFLQELKLEKEIIDKIMAENGSDIESAKASSKTETENAKKETDLLKTQLAEANKLVKSYKDMVDSILGIKTN